MFGDNVRGASPKYSTQELNCSCDILFLTVNSKKFPSAFDKNSFKTLISLFK